MLSLAVGLSATLLSQQLVDDLQQDSTIVVSSGPIEEFREHTLVGNCDEHTVTLRLTKRYKYGMSEFTASSNGWKITEDSVAAFEELNSKARGLTLVGFKCFDRLNVAVGFSGSYLRPESGQDDDFIEVVLVEFEPES